MSYTPGQTSFLLDFSRSLKLYDAFPTGRIYCFFFSPRWLTHTLASFPSLSSPSFFEFPLPAPQLQPEYFCHTRSLCFAFGQQSGGVPSAERLWGPQWFSIFAEWHVLIGPNSALECALGGGEKHFYKTRMSLSHRHKLLYTRAGVNIITIIWIFYFFFLL